VGSFILTVCFVDFVFIFYFVSSFVLVVIVVNPFRSYFVWFALWYTWWLVTGVSFCFVYVRCFYFAVCLFGLFVCFVVLVLYCPARCFVICGLFCFLSRCGGLVLVVKCLGVALPCTLFCGVGFVSPGVFCMFGLGWYW